MSASAKGFMEGDQHVIIRQLTLFLQAWGSARWGTRSSPRLTLVFSRRSHMSSPSMQLMTERALLPPLTLFVDLCLPWWTQSLLAQMRQTLRNVLGATLTTLLMTTMISQEGIMSHGCVVFIPSYSTCSHPLLLGQSSPTVER